LNLDELPPSQELPTTDTNPQVSHPKLPRQHSGPSRTESEHSLELDCEF